MCRMTVGICTYMKVVPMFFKQKLQCKNWPNAKCIDLSVLKLL